MSSDARYEVGSCSWIINHVLLPLSLYYTRYSLAIRHPIWNSESSLSSRLGSTLHFCFPRALGLLGFGGHLVNDLRKVLQREIVNDTS